MTNKLGLVPVEFCDFWVVGLEHHDGMKLWDQLDRGAVLQLAPDPDNPHDPNAVEVRLGGHMIGFVQKAVAKRLSPILRTGASYKCKVISREANESNKYEQILAVFYLFVVKEDNQ
jgi:hypothetical protein